MKEEKKHTTEKTNKVFEKVKETDEKDCNLPPPQKINTKFLTLVWIRIVKCNL